MKYFSTNHLSERVNFREAAIKGQAPDKGLYFPEVVPMLDKKFLKELEQLSREEVAFQVIQPFIGECIPADILYGIVKDTVNFPIPLVQIDDRIASLELFHGPTLAFKDIGARFMSRCLGYFLREEKKQVTVLVATSGDTGGAVANGFYGVEGVEVVILYPRGKVSPVQEKQLTTLGKNIRALEIHGSFDDCQRMVKEAFADASLNSELFLTSANSINVARWLPQQFYYFFAWQQWQDKLHPPVISVPSGNFGNICAGILAMQSGLPVKHFIAACNANDIMSDYLSTGKLQPKLATPTLSNAMDVGDPSNFVRILELFHHQFPELKRKLSAYRISDAETEAAIGELWKDYGYLADPHGAVGYLALKRYLHEHPDDRGIFLETAHPVKFPEAVERITGQVITMPEGISSIMSREKKTVEMEPLYGKLKEYLLNHEA